jgi:phosphoglucosamine mutase
MVRLPQVLVNVRLPVAASELDGVIERARPAVAAAEAELGDAGRVLLRRSGTEPLVRVMVEAPSPDQADAVAAGLAAAVEAACP